MVILQPLQAGLAGCVSRLRPRRSFHRPCDELGGVDDHMFGELALPGIGHMHKPVRGLDDGGITELGLRLILEHQRGFPTDAILAHGKVERTASLGDMVIDQQMAPVLERDGIGPGIRIGQVRQFDLRPRRALVTGDRAEDLGVTGSANRHEASVFQKKDARLNRRRTTLPLLDGDFLPRETVVAATLEMDLPRRSDLQSLGAASGQNRAILQLHGLVLDGAEDAFGQSASRTPSLAVIFAEAEQPPPLDRIRADLVIQLERSFLRLEEHGIPTGEALAVRLRTFSDLDRSRPLTVHATGRPDRDVRLSLSLSGEPSRHQRPVLRLDDRRRMTARHGVGLEDELRTDHARLGGDQPGGRQ